MSKAYEGIYEDGQIRWLGEEPPSGRHRVAVTVIDAPAADHTQEGIRRVLEQTRGAWGKQSTEEIDARVDQLRSEWDRPWYDNAQAE